nr:MAG TPA: hypothetical protein [Caudoviricetes sp.]
MLLLPRINKYLIAPVYSGAIIMQRNRYSPDMDSGL